MVQYQRIHYYHDNDSGRDRNNIILYNPIYYHLDIQFYPKDEEYQSKLTTTIPITHCKLWNVRHTVCGNEYKGKVLRAANHCYWYDES